MIRSASHVPLTNTSKETLVSSVEMHVRHVPLDLINACFVELIQFCKLASACVTPVTSWKMEVAQDVEAHVRLVPTVINVTRAQQASTLGRLSVYSVPRQRPSWVMYVPAVAQDAMPAQIPTRARLVKLTPLFNQTLVVLVKVVSSMTLLQTRVLARPERFQTQDQHVPVVIHLAKLVMI